MKSFRLYLVLLFWLGQIQFLFPESQPLFDTTNLQHIKIDRQKEKEVFSDREYLKEFAKKADGGQSESWLEWLLRKLFGNVSDKGMDMIWLIIKIVLGVLLVLALVFLFVKTNAIRIFRGDTSKIPLFGDLNEDINNIDIDKIVNDSVKAGDYKTAFRYTFLKSLQVLNAKGFIEWQAHKTNYEYYLEFKESKEKNIFKELYIGFEKVWYGEGQINKEIFERYQNDFNLLKGRQGV